MTHDLHNQPLPTLAMLGAPTDEVEETKPIKLEDSLTIFVLGYWVCSVAVSVLIRRHHQHRVVAVLEIWRSQPANME